MAAPYDKKDQSVREIKVLMKELINEGEFRTIEDAYKSKEYMDHAEKNGLVRKNRLLDFYDRTLLADELEHVIPKGKGGKFTISNCIPVASQHNPRRGYTDEPKIKLKRVCENLVRTDINSEEVWKRYENWKKCEDNKTNIENFEDIFLAMQLKLAKAVDEVVEEFCLTMQMEDPTPNARNKYAKKLGDRAFK